MCLSLDGLDEIRLAKGEHAGFEWEVVRNQLGYRCGYVRLPVGHPWFGRYTDIEVEVHGGLTFADYGTHCPTHGEREEWWIGFDCGHAFDLPDPALPSEFSQRIVDLMSTDSYLGSDYPVLRVWTQEMVEAEVRRLAEQARDAVA